MEVVEPQAALGELVDVRRGAQTTKAAELGESDVVEHHDEDVGRAFGRCRHGLRVPFHRVFVALP